MNDRVTRATSVVPAFGFGSNFQNAGVIGSDLIAPGDMLGLTIFENVKDDPLLGNTGQRVSALDEVQVDGQGFIFVPYAGRIKAAGQTPEGLRQIITASSTPRPPTRRSPWPALAGDGSTVSVSGSVVGAQGVYPDRTADADAVGDAGQGGRRRPSSLRRRWCA